MDVRILTENSSTPRSFANNPTLGTTSKILPKHKKSLSSLCNLNFTSRSNIENKYLSALTPRKIAEANYKKRDTFDMDFNLLTERQFRDTLEMKEKRQKLDERKRKDEEFTALKEAKLKLQLDEAKRNLDDLKREKEKLKVKQDLLIEKKKIENQFKQDKRNMFIEYAFIRRKQQWENRLKERELSVDTLRVRNPTFVI